MAQVKAFIALDMLSFDFSQLANGDLYTGNSTTYEIDYSNGRADIFLGFGFSYINDIPVSGVVTGYFVGSWFTGDVWYQATELSIPATAIVNAASTASLFDDILVFATALAGKDNIVGSPQKDRLVGFSGNDTLKGGKGADSFVYIGDDGRDTIKGFSSRQNDRIDLSSIDANENRGGDQRFRFIEDKSFSDKAGELRFASHKLQGDTDGDGRADLVIKLPDLDELSRADLYL